MVDDNDSVGLVLVIIEDRVICYDIIEDQVMISCMDVNEIVL
jgi:hypothetical protein